MKALSGLMMEKDFNSITTAEIANTAEVTEALIYKYFRDKKDLLYQVLDGLFSEFNSGLEREIKREKGAIEKIRVIILKSLEEYSANRVFAKMLFLEVRSSPRFFKSKAYQNIKIYAGGLLTIIEKGIEEGELKASINPFTMRKIILGAIEHACLGEIIFNRDLDIQTITDEISNILFEGAGA